MHGVYVLIIQLSKKTELTVGKLGKVHLPKGFYAYVGSAQNSLEKRIERHFRSEKCLFWHVDYLLRNPASKILKVFYKVGGKVEECHIATIIGAEGEAVPSFGCSDCRCKCHLIRVEAYDFIHGFMQEYKMPNLSASS